MVSLDLRRITLLTLKVLSQTGKEIGLKEGIQKGKELGLKEGELKTKIEIARNMLKDNLPLEVIEKYSGLTIEEIKKLR